MVTPDMVLIVHKYSSWKNTKTIDIILKAEQVTIAFAQWNR